MKRAQPVELIVGVIFSDPTLLQPLEAELENMAGTIEARSGVYAFDMTDYYRDEMGEGLKRIFYSFRGLIGPEEIADIKVRTGEIEREFSVAGRRQINIDPGYMDFYKIVLASGKYLGQKIYLGKGVYADPTLYYDKGWKPYDWGFPDFKGGRYNDFLSEVRTAYKKKIRHLTGLRAEDEESRDREDSGVGD